MRGTNKVILNEETMNEVFEDYIKNHLFKDGNFTVSKIDKRSYETEWTITLEGKEVADVTES